MLVPQRRPINPYFHSNAIDDPKAFFGRGEILNRLYSLVGSKQNVSLVGLRRIGKSSLLNCLRAEEIQLRYAENDLVNYIFVTVDLTRYPQHKPEDFLAFVTRRIVEESHGRVKLKISQPINTQAFDDLLTSINREGLYVVLLLDEFGSVLRNSNFDASFLGFLRSLANAKQVSYVTASRVPLDRMSHDGLVHSPFFNIFHTLELGRLETEEAKELITLPARNANCPFSDMDVKMMLDIAGRHPFFIQRACYSLFEKRCRRTESEDHNEQISLEREVYGQLRPHFTYEWEHLDNEQRDAVQNEARRISALRRTLPELTESSLFRRFVCEVCGISPYKIDVIHLKDALNRLGDPRYLGDSQFGYLNAIYKVSPNNELPALTTERGLLVSSFLRQAIEKLRPQGSRSETSPEWLLYNVLYFPYVANLTNSQAAARMGLSLRQFQRKLNDGLDALLRIIISMEEESSS